MLISVAVMVLRFGQFAVFGIFPCKRSVLRHFSLFWVTALFQEGSKIIWAVSRGCAFAVFALIVCLPENTIFREVLGDHRIFDLGTKLDTT